MSQVLQIELADLNEWLQKETEPLIKPLKDKGKNLLNEIADRLDDVQENGDRIFDKSDREIQKASRKTYRCAKAANKMSKNISKMVNQVAVPEEMSYENFQILLGDLEKTLASIKHERRVWDRRISPYFILDRRRLDIAIKRAEDSIQDLHSFLFQKYSKVKNVENTVAMIARLSQLLEEAEQIRKRKTRIEKRMKLVEEKILENEQKLGSIQDQAELDQLEALDQRIKDLRQKVKRNLRHLQKPFYKTQSLVRRGEVALPPDEVHKLQQYMKNPFEALGSEEEGHPVLKRILQKVDDAIRRGTLKLKASRLRKAKEQIDNILKRDSLANLHRDCLEVTSKKKRLLKSEKVSATQDKMEQFHATLQNLHKKKESVESRLGVLEEKHQRVLKKVETQKDELEKSIFKLTDKKVQTVLAKTAKPVQTSGNV